VDPLRFQNVREVKYIRAWHTRAYVGYDITMVMHVFKGDHRRDVSRLTRESTAHFHRSQTFTL